MSFASLEFGIFFAGVLAVYFLLDHRWQNRFLLLASYVFYGWWDWRFLGLILVSSLVDYFCALAVDRSRHEKVSETRRRCFLACSIATNLCILGFFKYYNFFADSLVVLFGELGVQLHPTTLKIVLPVGISFYTFQSMSYTIDVYRGRLRSTADLVDLLLYVSLFTQLVAGPIERGTHLLPQIRHPRFPTLDGFYGGAQLAFVGLFKKLVIADNMALLANSVYQTANPAGAEVILGTYAFALQIYCDFSGYTDIARGTARMLGFDICVNFRLPYLAANPNDFWQRWHVSLSTWLRDYLYIPLGGSRRGRLMTLRNLMITMLLGGLWHGASWHFVAWGAYHGVLLIVYRLFLGARRAREVTFRTCRGMRFWLSVMFFFQLTCLGWLLFRVTDLAQAGDLISSLVREPFWRPNCASSFLLVAAGGLPLLAFQVYQYYRRTPEPWTAWPWWLRASFYVTLFYALALAGAPGSNEFIYFQF